MTSGHLPPALAALAQWMAGREPAIRAKVNAVAAANPALGPGGVADQLVKDFRGRVVKSGAVTSAIGVLPGLSTLVEIGALGAQGAYATKQEIELVMAIAIAYGHDLAASEDRLLEVLAVAGVVTGGNLLRDRVLVEGGKRAARGGVARVTAGMAGRAARHAAARAAGRAAATGLRLVPLGVGVGLGAGFDYVSVTAIGRAAKRYYGPGGGGHLELPGPSTAEGNVIELPPASQAEP